MCKFISFDIMIGDQFIHTIAVSTLLADSIDRFGRPVFSPRKLSDHVISRLPTLRGKNFRLCHN